MRNHAVSTLRTTRHIRASAGFTLIELMIVTAVIAILAAVAYPSYMSQVRKSRRADAVASTVAIQQAQERWRANNPAYATTVAALGMATTSAKGYYGLAVSASSATGYTLTATATSGTSQASDSGCTTLTVTVANGSAAMTPAACWSN